MTLREMVHEAAAVMLAIVESTASKWRWYRRWCGGHWERWWIDSPVAGSIWLQNAHGERPGLGVSREACEDWTPRPVLPSTGSPYRDSAKDPKGGA